MYKTGVLLINLGTPNNCDSKSVHGYLKQFLNDSRVIDLPKFIRYFLVNGIIIPLRYKKSAHAYQQIWTEAGSPLLMHSLALVKAVKQELGPSIPIELGMRYGNPSIESALNKVKNCEKIIALPLFPQYSSAATGSAIEELFRVVGNEWNIPEITTKKTFFDNPDFILAYTHRIRDTLKGKKFDRLIFSYHGLPERHLIKSGCDTICSRLSSCTPPLEAKSSCYRAQCYETSRLIAAELGLIATDYIVSFQSRLGRTPWIGPYTDVILNELRKKRIENIAVVCPSFVADCLETLEEINVRARKQWLESGGSDFHFIPCLNSDPIWVVSQNNTNACVGHS